MAISKRHIQIGVAACIVFLATGWFALSKYAAGVARDEIDGFLVRNNLQGVVAYDGITATPFGTVTISDMMLGSPQGGRIKVRELVISGVQHENDRLVAVEAKARKADIPLLELRRNRGISDTTLLALGYTRLIGDCSMGFHYDSKRRTLDVSLGGKFDGLGEMQAQLGLGGVDPTLMGMSREFARFADNPLGLLALLGTLQSVTLSKNTLFLDSGPVHKRAAQITDAGTPSEQRAGTPVEWPLKENSLVMAGMRPSQAKELYIAGEKWAKEGGVLKVETHLDAPVPLLRQTAGGPKFVFEDAANFLVATKSTVEFR